ncbi:unnamed protein product [Spirodela intermedia]|uniref:Uncharacterized protein n=1 Tax=Spirodela intermedia TaxID=51605 RepID=A0A7I8J2S9_SPIIN|nr:unnamed protein product [Spirodela intermedia]CAA6664524.1 unnamed protein product [Spirodela intermedia]
MTAVGSLHGRRGLLLKRREGSSPAPFSGQFIRRISFSSRGLGDHLGACVSALQACASLREVSKGVAIHACAVVRGWLGESPFVVTSLVNFYSKCGRPGDALAVFRRAAGASNVFQWNAAIAGMAANGLPREALSLYREMEAAGLAPDKFTFPCAIMACADLYREGCCSLSLVELRSLHCRLTKMALQSDVFVSSALVNAYMKVDSMEYAARVFEGLPDRDVVLWNSMVNGLAQGSRLEDALRFFQRMAAEGVAPSKFTITGVVSKSGHGADVAVCNSLIDLYGKCGAVEEAGRIFGAVPEKDLLSWNSMITALVQSGDHGGALRLFDRMRRGPGEPSRTPSRRRPSSRRAPHGGADARPRGPRLPSCRRSAAARGHLPGQRRHGHVRQVREPGDARSLFERMPSRDVASWNIIIGGYAAQGGDRRPCGSSPACAARRRRRPPTRSPSSACSPRAAMAGWWRRGGSSCGGWGRSSACPPPWSTTPAPWTCSVARGCWRRLTSWPPACRRAQPGRMESVSRRLQAARRHRPRGGGGGGLLEMEPEHCGSYVLLSNAYGSAGRHGEVSAIRSAMRGRCVRKTPGCSWIELGTEVHAFVTGDRSHEASDSIYALLEALAGRLLECGYLPDAHPPGE